MKKTLTMGTRGSLLALQQAHDMVTLLKPLFPEQDLKIVEIQTQGDLDLKSSFQDMNTRSVFTKELDEALISGTIDLAVHSLKDLPSSDVLDLNLALVSHVSDARDVWVSRLGTNFSEIPSGSKIGTSSIRRQTILRTLNPTFQVEGLRGNLSTRLKKLKDGDLEGIILAAAGLTRLGWQAHITDYLPLDVFTPAAGQGMVGVVTRAHDDSLNAALKKIQDPVVWELSSLQRLFMKRLDGGCRVPLGFYIHPVTTKGEWMFYGYLANLDASQVIRHHMKSSLQTARDDLETFINYFKEQGCDPIIESLRL